MKYKLVTMSRLIEKTSFLEDLKEFEEMIENMKHTIGFDNRKVKGTKYRKYKCYRNYFTGISKSLDKAAELGLVTKRELSKKYCGGFCYSVSDKGFKFLSRITGVEVIKGATKWQMKKN